MNRLSLRDIAVALGGEVHRNQVRAPAPGHSKHDRSLVVKLADEKLAGFVVQSFANEDALFLKDYVRECVGLPQFGSERREFTAEERALSHFALALASGPSNVHANATYQLVPTCILTTANVHTNGVPTNPLYPMALCIRPRGAALGPKRDLENAEHSGS